MTKSLFIGTTKVHLNEVDSTNNYARSLIQDKLPIEGTVVTADVQTNGRGQRSNKWETEGNLNLTCSYILRPAFLAAKNQFVLSAAVALAVFETVSEFLPTESVEIKWPNDIIVNQEKIAGILIENNLRGMNLHTSIVGIGLNVNQTKFPSSIKATSIKNHTEQTELVLVLDSLNKKLEKYYLRLRDGKRTEILSEFNNHLFGVRKELKFTINKKEETAEVVSVLETGEIQLKRNDSSITSHQHHEISWHL